MARASTQTKRPCALVVRCLFFSCVVAFPFCAPHHAHWQLPKIPFYLIHTVTLLFIFPSSIVPPIHPSIHLQPFRHPTILLFVFVLRPIVELSHFHLLRSVGKGAFGKVRVVQHKKTKEIYALKYINKAKCIRMRAVENIIQERRLLEEVEFSLICNLRYAFQDDENLFMVLDLMLGGDLRFHLERAGPMREDVVRFYVAELALALDALHSRRIVHR